MEKGGACEGEKGRKNRFSVKGGGEKQGTEDWQSLRYKNRIAQKQKNVGWGTGGGGGWVSRKSEDRMTAAHQRSGEAQKGTMEHTAGGRIG